MVICRLSLDDLKTSFYLKSRDVFRRLVNKTEGAIYPSVLYTMKRKVENRNFVIPSVQGKGGFSFQYQELRSFRFQLALTIPLGKFENNLG